MLNVFYKIKCFFVKAQILCKVASPVTSLTIGGHKTNRGKIGGPIGGQTNRGTGYILILTLGCGGE